MTSPVVDSRAWIAVRCWLVSARSFLASEEGEIGADQKPDAPGDLRTGLSLLARPALLGLAAVLAMAWGAAQQSSPFALKVPGAWFFGIPSLTTPPGRLLLPSLLASYGGCFLLVRAWLALCSVLRRTRGVNLWAVGAVFALWVLPLLLAPPMFSRDVYSYAAQGDMVTHGISPYVHGPVALGLNDPYVTAGVDTHNWGASPAPYGPFFMAIDAAIVTITGHHPLATVVGLRLLELGGVVLLGFALASLARDRGRDGAFVLGLALCNPLVLAHLIAGAHNDGLMIGLLAAGLAVGRRGRPVLGIVLCALAAAVKVPAAVGVLYIAWQWAGAGVPWRSRLRPLVYAGLITVATFALLSATTGLGWGWMKGLGNPGSLRSWTDPMTGLGMVFGHLTSALGLPIGVTGMVTVFRATGELAAVVAAVLLLLGSERIGWLKSLSLSLFLVVTLGPTIFPWYLAWPVVLMAPVVGRRWRVVVSVTTVVGFFIGFPGSTELVTELRHTAPWSFAACVLIASGIVFPPAIGWMRRAAAARAEGVPLAALAEYASR